MSAHITCIVGLGNPGANYKDTRHNIGFWFIDALAQQQHLTFQRDSKFAGLVSHIPQPRIWLLKPDTFMNRSGQAVRALMTFYRIPIEQILVVHDDIDLPVGTARLKHGGGHGGHNGLRDIISQTGSREFLRLRLGIGRPEHSAQVVNYVLKAPSLADKQQLQQAINHSLNVLPQVLNGELAQAMNTLHSGT